VDRIARALEDSLGRLGGRSPLSSSWF